MLLGVDKAPPSLTPRVDKVVEGIRFGVQCGCALAKVIGGQPALQHCFHVLGMAQASDPIPCIMRFKVRNDVIQILVLF